MGGETRGEERHASVAPDASCARVTRSLLAPRNVLLVLAALGFLISAYLTYLELFVIGALCQWCLASATIMPAALICTTLAALPLMKQV